MPICKRDGFDNAPSKNKEETFHDNDDVFFCEVTKEIFKEYEDYFRHVMAINSTVWQCEATGKDNLTYAEALKSEKRARKKMEMFKDCLRPPVMMVIDHAKQSSLSVLNALTFRFLRKRFFLKEEVQIAGKSSVSYVVLAITSEDNKVPDNGVYEDTDSLMYKLKRKSQETELTVPYDKVRRQRFEFTSENLQMFIKNNVIRVDGILRPKPESYKKYVTDRKITFKTLFIGEMPHFTPAKIRKPDESKKQSTLNTYFGKKENDKATTKLSAEEKAKQEKEKVEKSEAKAKSLKEQMERVKREKEAALVEQMRKRAEKRAILMKRIEKECDALLNKTDDLERTDQRLMPTYTPIQTIIPIKLLGDTFMLREFMHTYEGILSGIEVFKTNLGFSELARSFTVREVAGPLSDIILILLGSIFDLQREEEEEVAVEFLKSTQPIPFWSHQYVRRHFYFRLNELPLDALTVSEVLRLHLLASGAILKNKNAEKWRIMYRNGYTSSEDPGISLRMQHPHIIRALKMYTIYQLPFLDIMRVLKCLMAQMLTYSGTINVIEERMEQMASARQEIKMLVTAENQRLSKVQVQRKALTNEFNQQCMEEEVKNNPEKRNGLEDKLNKKVAELLALSERSHKKYEQQVAKVNSALFNFLVYLGMDRAYRKYYVLESMPGIFVEHPTDCMDKCLENPPKNCLPTGVAANKSNLPKNRKDLRSYLLKMYSEEEKKANVASNNIKKAKSEAAQEDKENLNQQNGTVNSLANGHATEVKMDVDEVLVPPPTQYQLFMCTGNPRDCIVHDERNTDRQRWSYLYKEEDTEALIDSLNPLGFRESQLREQLQTLKELIQEHVRKCPTDVLNVAPKQIQKFHNIMMSDTNRKYHNSNFGFPVEGSDLNEVMYGALVERVLSFEMEIYSGDLGRLKVKDMERWRSDLHNSRYDPQAKLQWGPPKQQTGVVAESDEEEKEDSENENEQNETEERNYSGKPYNDPGQTLGETLEIDSEDSADEGISLHDSDTLRSYVKQLASALLQVEQAVERRFFKEPFGIPHTIKDKDLLERKNQQAINRLRQWEVSLMESTSYSQVFLHLNLLHDCIMWARSTNKSNCVVCRRGSDPDKMLLCDECNGGTHMFCMKPKMKTVPEGNWYCKRCVNHLGLENANDKKNKKTQRRKLKFIVDEDNSDVESVSSESTGAKGKTVSKGRNKRLQSNEIEDMLDDDEEEVEDDEETLDEDVKSEEEEDNDEDTDGDENNEKEEDVGQSKDQSEVDEDESVCNVCSYDGSELSCTTCKDTFHLECINLKRMPRYNFVCSKCKVKEGNRKRKSKANDSSSQSDESSDDDEPIVKRGRTSRPSSQRNSLANTKAEQDPLKLPNSRRSIRRTADNLPLNNSLLYELLEKIMKHENAWPFLRPVSQAEVPDYYDIIKNPMDFARVKSKLNMGSYQINEEVMRDVELVFRNCDDYNVKGNEIYEAGSALEKYVIDLCNELNLPFKPSDMNSEV